MKEESYARYDRIRSSECGDRFDPFNMHENMGVKNSYISMGGGSSFIIDYKRSYLRRVKFIIISIDKVNYKLQNKLFCFIVLLLLLIRKGCAALSLSRAVIRNFPLLLYRE